MLGALACAASLAALCCSAYVVFFALLGRRVGLRAATVADGEGRPDDALPRTRFVTVIPAHNESVGLLPTLASVAEAAYPQALLRTVVLADNCTDDTAAVAAAAADQDAGAVDVWSRSDPAHPGKGQALAWAFARLTDEGLNPKSDAGADRAGWDAIVVLDADTVVTPHFFSALDRAFAASLAAGEPLAVQGRYEFVPAPVAAAAARIAHPAAAETGSWFDTLTSASKAAENSYVYRPRAGLGLVTLLQGNGFAVNRAALARAPFEAGSIVEDAEYALELALAGVRVGYVDQARVLSRMTARVEDAAPQRLRWAGGIFALVARAAPKLMRASLARRDWRLAEAALMLLLTSRLVLIYLTALAAALVGVALLHAGLGFAFETNGSMTLLAALALLCAIGLQIVYLGLVFEAAPGATISLGTLLRLPAYLAFVGWAQCRAALGTRRGLWHRTVR